VYEVTGRLSEKLSSENLPKLKPAGHQLVGMYGEGLAKTSRPVLELICSAELTSGGGIPRMPKKRSRMFWHATHVQEAGKIAP